MIWLGACIETLKVCYIIRTLVVVNVSTLKTLSFLLNHTVCIAKHCLPFSMTVCCLYAVCFAILGYIWNQ